MNPLVPARPSGRSGRTRAVTPSEAVEVLRPGVRQSDRLEPAAGAVTSTVPALPVSEGIAQRTRPGGSGGSERGAPVGVSHPKRYRARTGVFSKNVPAALELANRIESGICHVNDTTVHDEPQCLSAASKRAASGRFGGRAAFEEFAELRWITVQDLPRQYPI
jgi:Aldehyde dehydrogenase family